jgi:hypothetical protein
LPTLNVIELIRNFYADVDKGSISHSLTIENVFYDSKMLLDYTAVLSFENRLSRRQQDIYLKLICKEMSIEIDFEQHNPIIKHIGQFFHKISLGITVNNKKIAIILSHITRYCTQLNHLDIYRSGKQYDIKEEIFACNLGSTKSLCVKTLVLNKCTLFQKQLSYIVKQLSQLKELVLRKLFGSQPSVRSFLLFNWSILYFV